MVASSATGFVKSPTATSLVSTLIWLFVKSAEVVTVASALPAVGVLDFYTCHLILIIDSCCQDSSWENQINVTDLVQVCQNSYVNIQASAIVLRVSPYLMV